LVANAVDRLEAAVAEERILQTAEHGTIELTTDDARWWVKTAR
jgi:beta-lactamase superfamily II metal-dependent hydrolase